MAAACCEDGLPAPKPEEIGTRFRVTLSLVARQGPELNERDRKILELLADGNGHSTQQISDHLQLSTRATRGRLRALIERGLVVEVGSSPQDPRRAYLLAARV